MEMILLQVISILLMILVAIESGGFLFLFLPECLVVEGDGFLHHFQCSLPSFKLFDFHHLFLKDLVVGEESVNLLENVLWQFRDIVDVGN